MRGRNTERDDHALIGTERREIGKAGHSLDASVQHAAIAVPENAARYQPVMLRKSTADALS
jgi:hypothetical protein